MPNTWTRTFSSSCSEIAPGCLCNHRDTLLVEASLHILRQSAAEESRIWEAWAKKNCGCADSEPEIDTTWTWNRTSIFVFQAWKTFFPLVFVATLLSLLRFPFMEFVLTQLGLRAGSHHAGTNTGYLAISCVRGPGTKKKKTHCHASLTCYVIHAFSDVRVKIQEYSGVASDVIYYFWHVQWCSSTLG